MSEPSCDQQRSSLSILAERLRRVMSNLYHRGFGVGYWITCIPARLRHRLRSRVIAAPGFLGFDGGLYNPGAVATDRGGVVLLARGQAVHWLDCRGNLAGRFLEGSPAMITLNREMKIESRHVIRSVHGFPPFHGMGIEDFRLFRFEGQIWANHGQLRFRIRDGRARVYEATQTLSILDPTRRSLTCVGSPRLDLETKKIEKNWSFVEAGGELYLLYSFQPYRVLKLQDRNTLQFRTCVNRDLGQQMADIVGYGTMVSLSTNPIEYDARHLMVVIHQVKHRNGRRGKFYGQWGVLIEKATMLPKKITATPLFTGRGARGRLRTTLYVMSVLCRLGDFVFFSGEGDSHLSRVTVSGSRLEKLWRDIPAE